jgi:hypothetical protein
MTYFNKCENLDELRAEYRRLIKLHHPDVGGNAETMKAINNEYDLRFDELKRGTPHAGETPDAYRAAVESLLHLQGIIIELCGCWLWVTGNTYRIARHSAPLDSALHRGKRRGIGTRQTLRPLATGKKLLTKSAASTARNFLRAQAAPL